MRKSYISIDIHRTSNDGLHKEQQQFSDAKKRTKPLDAFTGVNFCFKKISLKFDIWTQSIQ